MCSKYKAALINGIIDALRSSFRRAIKPMGEDGKLDALWLNLKEMFGIRFNSVQDTDMKELTLKNIGELDG